MLISKAKKLTEVIEKINQFFKSLNAIGMISEKDL